jgi:hypothetical protein
VAVSWQAWCFKEASGGMYGGPFRWVLVATPQTVAAGLYRQVKGTVPEPVVVTSPPAGVAAIVGVPMFVSVSNWRGPITRTGNLLGVGVTVVATPTLVIDPADGSPTVTCAGGGRPYEPGGGELWRQATSPDACTHTYEHRTGVEGHPAKWPTTVTVRWSITWSASDGEGGSFPVVDRSVSLARAVREVQSIVESGA